MSSRSSVHSDSSRVYTPDMLLQLATGLSSSPTASIGSFNGGVLATLSARSNWAFKNEALSAALEHFPDISTADDDLDHAAMGLGLERAAAAAADENGAAATEITLTRRSTSTTGDANIPNEEDDGFVYGQGDIRSDLDPFLVDQLSKAIHDALSPSSPRHPGVPRQAQVTSSLPPVLVDSLVPSPRPRTLGAYTKRMDTLSNGYGFGDRRPVRGRSPSTSRPIFTHGGAFNQRAHTHHTFAPASAYGSGNGQQRRHTFTRRQEHPTMSKEDTVTSWRKLDEGLKWSWNDDAGAYMIITA